MRAAALYESSFAVEIRLTASRERVLENGRTRQPLVQYGNRVG